MCHCSPGVSLVMGDHNFTGLNCGILFFGFDFFFKFLVPVDKIYYSRAIWTCIVVGLLVVHRICLAAGHPFETHLSPCFIYFIWAAQCINKKGMGFSTNLPCKNYYSGWQRALATLAYQLGSRYVRIRIMWPYLHLHASSWTRNTYFTSLCTKLTAPRKL